MAGRAIDLTGQVFGKLTVVARVGTNSNGKATWQCQCLCGKEHTASGLNLRHGLVKSCGCLRYETYAFKHGHSVGNRTPAYRAWKGMRHRCTNEASVSYKYYGGRGITVDPRWNDFRVFLAEMGEPPAGFSLDRKDNNLGYSKENCQWSSPSDQRKNRRFVTWVEIFGKRMTLNEAIDAHAKASKAAVLTRIGKGWPILSAILTPPNERPVEVST